MDSRSSFLVNVGEKWSTAESREDATVAMEMIMPRSEVTSFVGNPSRADTVLEYSN
jgi:hypothetical protein